MFFYDQGCTGRIALGPLPADVETRLARLPGDWLEFDSASHAIVLRHTQPSTTPPLPTIAGELVRILAEVGPEHHAGIPGGDLFVHPEGGGQLVRMRVEPGATLHIQWAHPDFEGATRRAYAGGQATSIDPEVQRLDGMVRFAAPDGAAAARALRGVAADFEGLYPEGDFKVTAGEDGKSVEVRLREVNLDSALFAASLMELASTGTLEGAVEVTSLSGDQPEEHVRFLFETGKAWVQRPILWETGRTSR
jgi:hypothetical protein